MIELVVSALYNFWPSALAVVIAVCVSASTRIRERRRAAILAVVLAVAVTAVYGWILRDQVTDPRSNILGRDVAGRLLIGAAAPLLTVFVAAFARFRGVHVWVAEVISGLVGAVWILVGPLILLYIHCSSGDCL
jgi:chromate transport protein ChrA